MVWVFFICVAVLVVAVAAGLISGRVTADPMAEPTATTPHHGLPAQGARASDVVDVRFDTALRGYRMDQVDEVLDLLADRIHELEQQLGATADRAPGDGPVAATSDEPVASITDEPVAPRTDEPVAPRTDG